MRHRLRARQRIIDGVGRKNPAEEMRGNFGETSVDPVDASGRSSTARTPSPINSRPEDYGFALPPMPMNAITSRAMMITTRAPPTAKKILFVLFVFFAKGEFLVITTV